MHKTQKYFGDRSIIAMMALLSAFPALSTDLYLPALPNVMEVLQASQTQVNLSLSLFFISFAIGILIWGPVSEKYGRKPILLIGLTLYILSSAGCALSFNVTLLIVSRVFQAFGGGAAGAVVTAMVKDMYDGRKRESVLALVMTMVIVAPVVAPAIGAVILKYMPWNAIFWILAIVGVVSFLLCFLLEETLETRYTGSVIHSLGRLAVVMKNPGFSILLGIFSMVPLPLMAFIAASAFIYIQGFGTTEEVYSFYFGFNALGAFVGPLLYIRLSRWVSPGNIIAVCYGLITICGIVLNLAGSGSIGIFAVTMLVATLAMSLMRPPTANLLLCQQVGDTGSAASLINFLAMFMGSIGMFLISLETENLISSLGLMQALVGIVCGSLWLILRGRSFIRQPY